jgi:hypothetical protein
MAIQRHVPVFLHVRIPEDATDQDVDDTVVEYLNSVIPDNAPHDPIHIHGFHLSQAFKVTKPEKEQIREKLHRLWTKAVGTPDYDKKEWQALEVVVMDLVARLTKEE